MAAPSAIAHADVETAKAVAPVRGTWPVRLLGAASEVADQPQLITLCAATFAAGLLLRDRRLADTGGRMLAAELIATGLKSLVKANVDRTRPYVVADGGEHVLEPGHSRESRDNSFPSGHTAGAVAVARAVARGYPDHAVAAYATAGSIAAIQIPRCRHYPSDLAAGAVVGLAAEAIVAAGARLAAKLAR
jgi:membrane-associated phospholipid phosphatase